MTRKSDQAAKDRYRGDPAERRRAGRVVGASVVGFLLSLYVWQTRGELGMSLPALGLCTLVGLAGVGLASLVRRLRAGPRGRRPLSDAHCFLASTIPVALVVGGVTWFAGEWMGGRSVMGSVWIAFIVGILLLFGRHAVQGPPAEDPGDDQDRR